MGASGVDPIGLYSEILEEAIDNAIDNGRNGLGCIVVFSSGNDCRGSVSYPANYRKEIMAVGAIDNKGARSFFSNYGTHLDVVAPGDFLVSTVLDNKVDKKSGTSFAAPHVCAIAALMLSIKPDLTGQQVRDIIEQTTQKIEYTWQGNIVEYSNVEGRHNGTWNEHLGYGLVDAYEAVKATVDIVKNSLKIQGPDALSDVGADYTIAGLPKDAQVEWVIGSELVAPNGTGSATLFVKSVRMSTSSVIKAHVTCFGSTYTIEKELVQTLPKIELEGNSTITIGMLTSNRYYLRNTLPASSTVSWSVSPALTIVQPNPLPSYTSQIDVSARSYAKNQLITATVTVGNRSETYTKEVSLYQPIANLIVSGPFTAFTGEVKEFCVEELHHSLEETTTVDRYVWYVKYIRGGAEDYIGEGTSIHTSFATPGVYTIAVSAVNDTHGILLGEGSLELTVTESTSSILVYPNPASSQLTIALKSIDMALLKKLQLSALLYNQSSQLVGQQAFGDQSIITMNVSNLPNGVYFLNIVSKGNLLEQQTVIVKH